VEFYFRLGSLVSFQMRLAARAFPVIKTLLKNEYILAKKETDRLTRYSDFSQCLKRHDSISREIDVNVMEEHFFVFRKSRIRYQESHFILFALPY